MKQWHETKFPGVRYREHPTRRHGIAKDRYFVIRYSRDRRQQQEVLGWSSQGWSAEKAAGELAELKKNIRLGSGPGSLREKRTLQRERKEQAAREKARLEREAVTFATFYEKVYCQAHDHKKTDQHMKHWIKPLLGPLPLKDVRPFHIEKIKKTLLDADKSPRTVQHVFATIRQVWNHARRDSLVVGESPTKQVKVPKFDNRRQRFLSHEEANCLLADLEARDSKVYQMTLLSLHTGLRAGEVFSLRWGHVDLDRGMISVVDTKGGRNRAAYLTQKLKGMFLSMRPNDPRPDALVFPNEDGGRFTEIPRNFKAAVDALNLNKEVLDRRQQVVFHTLRHTYASWHVEGGTDLYTVKKLLGHGTIGMTERYSHLAPGMLQNAVQGFERAIEQAKKEKSSVVELKKQG